MHLSPFKVEDAIQLFLHYTERLYNTQKLVDTSISSLSTLAKPLTVYQLRDYWTHFTLLMLRNNAFFGYLTTYNIVVFVSSLVERTHVSRKYLVVHYMEAWSALFLFAVLCQSLIRQICRRSHCNTPHTYTIRQHRPSEWNQSHFSVVQ